MADEVAQVVDFEMKGMKFLIITTVELAKATMNFIRWLFNERYQSEWLVKSGETKISVIAKMSVPDQPAILKAARFNDEEVKKLKEALDKVGIHYCIIDGNANSPYYGIMVPPKEAGRTQLIIQQMTAEDKKPYESELDKYTAQKEELVEQLRNATDPNEIKVLQTKIENTDKAIAENQKRVLTLDEIINSPDLNISYTELMQLCCGPEFTKNPNEAFKKLVEGKNQVPEFTAKEAFLPLRSWENTPEEKTHFYLPEVGCSVERTYEQDADGLCFSTYKVVNDNGDTATFTDKGLTDSEWYQTGFKNLLDFAGMSEDTKVKVFLSEKAMIDYSARLNFKLNKGYSPQSVKENEFSSPEAKNFVTKSISESVKKQALEEIEMEKTTLHLIRENIGFDEKTQQMRAVLDNGDSITLPKDDVISITRDNEGFIHMKYPKDYKVTMCSENGDKKEVALSSVASRVNVAYDTMHATKSVAIDSISRGR